MEERVPRPEAEQRRAVRHHEQAAPHDRARPDDRVDRGRTAFERVRERRERQRRHEARPHDEREHVGRVRAGAALGDDVADRPREPRCDHQQETHERPALAGAELVRGEERDPCHRDARADEVVPLQLVAFEHDGEPDREEHLQLDHERREPRRHAELHSEEEQTELQDADRDPVADHVAPRHRRAPDEEHERQRGERKAHGS